MSVAFADSFYWLALLHPRDPHHLRVTQLNPPPRLVTSVAVQIEVMDALCGPAVKGVGRQSWDMSRRTETWEVIPLSEDMLERAVGLFCQRHDKAWSLTDCISFTIMSDHGIRRALTGDHHFVQAGFEIAFP